MRQPVPGQNSDRAPVEVNANGVASRRQDEKDDTLEGNELPCQEGEDARLKVRIRTIIASRSTQGELINYGSSMGYES